MQPGTPSEGAPESTLRRWTNPYDGQNRRYLDGWEQAIGLKIWRYHSGNVSEATLDRKRISNTEGGRMSGKAWLDDADQLHLDHYFGVTLTARQVTRRITAAMQAQDAVAIDDL